MSRLRDRMIEDLRLHGRADNTIRTYVRCVRKLVEWAGVAPGRSSGSSSRRRDPPPACTASAHPPDLLRCAIPPDGPSEAEPRSFAAPSPRPPTRSRSDPRSRRTARSVDGHRPTRMRRSRSAPPRTATMASRATSALASCHRRSTSWPRRRSSSPEVGLRSCRTPSPEACAARPRHPVASSASRAGAIVFRAPQRAKLVRQQPHRPRAAGSSFVRARTGS